MDAAGILDRLFNKAREEDEFEYICALLRIRGMEDEGWDPLEETQRLYDDVGSLMEAPLNPYAQIRLGLLLYSHLTEVDAIYMILANMVEITAGERCVMNPFDDLYRTRGGTFGDRIPPSARAVVERLKERAAQRGCTELVELLNSFFNDAVRNAFFHSDYILHEDEFRSREARFIDENNVRTSSLKLDVIFDLINRSAAFFHDFMQTYGAHRLSYKEPKVVRGRIGPGGAYEDIALLVHPTGGVYGFRGGGDAGTVERDMLASMNYGLIERAADGTETFLTASYNADDAPPYVGQTLNVEEAETPRAMTVVEIGERPNIKPDVEFVIVQAV